MTVSYVGVSEGVPVNAVVETSIAASVSALFARSPAEPTLDGSDKISTIETSVSSKVDQLEQLNRADANMACAVKPTPIATMGHIIDLMHWHTYPRAGLLGPATVRHWRAISIFSACILPIVNTLYPRAQAQH